jgi:L-ascorbate metabolism protein UlaG (beta-lactamase superfamily)
MILAPVAGTPAEMVGNPGGPPALAWLGQAGFLIRSGGVVAGIDLYLSDSLAEKYAGKVYPHQRMVPVPVDPGELRGLNLLLATHGHTDHLDPGTIPPLQSANPGLRIVCPRAVRSTAIDRGADPESVVTIDAGETIEPVPGWRITAIPAAHEELTRNESGEYLYLGYVVEAPGVTIYHAGDGIPYDGLAETVAVHHPDIALLPVNGRDEVRRSRGVPGNLTKEEALWLCRNAGIPFLVPMHFGMFDFNTVSKVELRRFLTREAPIASVDYAISEIGRIIEITR